jgi:hypothetical protein
MTGNCIGLLDVETSRAELYDLDKLKLTDSNGA